MKVGYRRHIEGTLIISIVLKNQHDELRNTLILDYFLYKMNFLSLPLIEITKSWITIKRKKDRLKKLERDSSINHSLLQKCGFLIVAIGCWHCTPLPFWHRWEPDFLNTSGHVKTIRWLVNLLIHAQEGANCTQEHIK